MNPIAYLISQGFKVTSDPARYKSGIWGLRNYTVNGYNYDQYCGGYHRAFDLVKYDRAPIPAVFDGIVTAGTNHFGNLGVPLLWLTKTWVIKSSTAILQGRSKSGSGSV